MKKILHIVTDDHFSDYAIRQFSAPEMCSDFVLIPSNNCPDEVKEVDRCTIIKRNSSEFEALLNRLCQYSGIVLHGMFWGSWQTPLLKRVPDHVKVAWVFWGGDLYSRQENKGVFYAPITNFFSKLHKRKKNSQPDSSWEIPLELYKRVDYCITSVDDEYDFACEFTQSSFPRVWYSYYSIEETVGTSLMDSRVEGNSIWIGNSATSANNHLDVFGNLLKSGVLKKWDGNKVIMPLSYGEPWVRNTVKKVGRWLFGMKLQVLEQYIPRNEYNALMLSCSTMIIGYWEPAANGNIMTALWLGMRVYLSEKSMAFAYYKRLGCVIFSIEHDLNRNNSDCFSRLSDEEWRQNRKALTKEYGKQRTDQAVVDLVHLLTADN